MDRIAQAFKDKQGRAALIPFLSAGDPDLDTSYRLFCALLEKGADIVEIGIPYSDPLADGPIIQAASLRSIHGGFSLPQVFELTAKLRSHTNKGLVLFTYINPILQYGVERFVKDAAESGADGMIVPDAPMEESAEIRRIADQAGIALIPLVTPTSGQKRVEAIVKDARGFVYCVSSLGVTGERAKMSERVEELVQMSKNYSNLPVAVGFGVSTPEQATNIARYADGVIVGSAYIKRIENLFLEHKLHPCDTAQVVRSIEMFTEDLVRAVR